MDEPLAPEPRIMLSGRYRLEAQLGSGGSGRVFRAFDETLERAVAIKVLHGRHAKTPAQVARFRREALLVARLNNPGIVAVFDTGEHDGRPFIIYEYVEGPTLKQLMEHRAPLPMPPDEAVRCAAGLAYALDSAHRHGAIHRDVKPQNILAGTDGRLRLTDFGICHLAGAQSLTDTGNVLGTAEYSAPEQVLGEELSSQADVYSLGIVLFEMITGVVPFTGDSQVSIALQHIQGTVPDVRSIRSDVSPRIAAIVSRATAKSRRLRYADMNSLLADVERDYLRIPSGSTVDTAPPERPKSRFRSIIRPSILTPRQRALRQRGPGR